MALRVAVSVGHWPEDQGAAFRDVSEYGLLAPVVGFLVRRLTAAGAHAFLVPARPLSKKIQWVNARAVDLAVEVHANADPDPDGPDDPEAYGAETLFCKGSAQGVKAAAAIQEQLVASFIVSGPPVRDRGVKARSNLGFLTGTAMPAVIVEPEFIDHIPGLGALLENPEVVGYAIADGILAWDAQRGR